MSETTYVNQSDLLHGTFAWQYQIQLNGVHGAELSGRLGSLDVFSDPALVLQPMDSLQPAQLAVQMNILAYTLPRLGPVIAQLTLQGGVQWQAGQGAATTLQPGLDLSLAQFDWFHVQGGIQLNITSDGNLNLHTEVQVPVSTVSAAVHF